MTPTTTEQLEEMDAAIRGVTERIVGDDREFAHVMTILQNTVASVCLNVSGSDVEKSCELVDKLADRVKHTLRTRPAEFFTRGSN